MQLRERFDGETDEQFINRRAREIHREETEINDPFLSPDERAFRLAKLVGLIPTDASTDEE